MERRSDKYTTSENNKITSRVSKNETLYDELNSKIGYEDIAVFDESNKIDLSLLGSKEGKRENYAQLKEYQNIMGSSEIQKESSFSKVTTEVIVEEKKEFDINKVLEEAKKNREDDSSEKKRKLEDEEYSVLNSLNKKYLHKKDYRDTDDDEIRELVDTITSNSLAAEVKEAEEQLDKHEESKDLFSDLMATSTNVDINLEEVIAKEILLKEEKKEKEPDEEEQDDSFYTKSLELNDDDFASDTEDAQREENSDFEDIKNESRVALIVVSAILLALIAVVIFFTLRHFGIIQ